MSTGKTQLEKASRLQLSVTQKNTLKPVLEMPSQTDTTGDNYSQSISTLSSMSDVTEGRSETEVKSSASPQDHLHKLKRIHRRVKQRRRWRRFRKMGHFFITRVFVTIILLSSIILTVCSYLLDARILLAVGCIGLLASIGCMVQICFSYRTGPNKFNPASIPFSVPPEYLFSETSDHKEQETSSKRSNVDPVNVETPTSNSNLPNAVNTDVAAQQPQTGSTNNLSTVDVNTRRLSMALMRIANTAMQPAPFYRQDKETGVLNMARRLTLASSAMGLDHQPVGSMYSHNWVTGSHIRHGVRRSLAWNATGASRFYEDTYD